MKRFSKLVYDLDHTTSDHIQTILLTEYFIHEQTEKDKLWAISLFIGERPSRIVNTALLSVWAAEVAGIPLWLFEENYKIVGDLTETISSILPIRSSTKEISLSEWVQMILDARPLDDDAKKSFVLMAWEILDREDLWIFNKLITGGFRIRVSKYTIIQALSKASDTESNIISYNLMGKWSPLETSWKTLIDTHSDLAESCKPYPFSVSQDITGNEVADFKPETWVAEWKWEGLRIQLIVRSGQVHLWSSGEELITDRFPEFKFLEDHSDSFVLDGHIVGWDVDKPTNTSTLHTRLGRKTPSKKLIQEIPARFIAHDILEINNNDIRKKPLKERREILAEIVRTFNKEDLLSISPWLPWKETFELIVYRENAKNIRVGGLILKNLHGPYGVGQNSNDILQWKSEPYIVSAVLIYAQRGSESNATLFSDFTFAVWHEGKLLPFAKSNSGLTDLEMHVINDWVKLNTVEKFGPVSSVIPQLVFEISFESVSTSNRHKSGVTVRFPRIHTWCKDKKPEEADTLDKIKTLII